MTQSFYLQHLALISLSSTRLLASGECTFYLLLKRPIIIKGFSAVIKNYVWKISAHLPSILLILMPENEAPNQEGAKPKCQGCKHGLEHLASVLPFSVLETMTDKPLKIRGVAMTTGMSRNLNIYTAEELQAFTDKLANAPVYIEHVSVPNAIGKVSKTDWDGHNLWYEAEIYDEVTAEKIRKGLIQHVSVGADYEAIDLVDGKVPHGLHNAELSLVAVPGIPETNVEVLEKLTQTEGKLSEAQKTIEDLRKQVPGGSLLKNPSKMMPISEYLSELEDLRVPLIVERSGSGGMQQLCQKIRSKILKAQERLRES
jgi:hypothetical protein